MRRISICFVLLSIVFLITGCTHDEVVLTHEGKLVQEIEPNATEDCKYIRQVQASTGSDSESDAIATLRNKVGVGGGNAYTNPSFSDSDSVTEVKADAYKCYSK